MKRVAVFGNAGGGKSTLARRLAETTGLPLVVLDILQYPGGYRRDRAGGGAISDERYLELHGEILAGAEWIIDGYGSLASALERFAVADTLVHLDLPLAIHCWGVTKRLVKGLFETPLGWPENSPVLRSSLNAYRVIWPCHDRLTPLYRRVVADSASKRVHHLRSRGDMRRFLEAVPSEYRGGG